MNKVRTIREARRLTQAELAFKVDTSQQQIDRVEKGQKVTLALACKISGALRHPLADLFPAEMKFTYQ